MAGISTVTVADRQTAGSSAVTMGSALPANIKTTARRSLTNWSGSKVAFNRSTRPTSHLPPDPLTQRPASGLDHLVGSRRDLRVARRRGDAKLPVRARSYRQERRMVPPPWASQSPSGAHQRRRRERMTNEVVHEIHFGGLHGSSPRQPTIAAPKRGPSAPNGDRRISTCDE